MEMQKEEAKMLQWHPAFFAEIQIELQEDAEHLIFENEHQLGTKPKEIDVLIIKKDKGRVIRKNIGRIFRQHNIVEYKSPLDYLSVWVYLFLQIRYQSDGQHSDRRTYDYSGNRKISTKIDAPLENNTEISSKKS